VRILFNQQWHKTNHVELALNDGVMGGPELYYASGANCIPHWGQATPTAIESTLRAQSAQTGGWLHISSKYLINLPADSAKALRINYR
jgi:hypothetical protein